jgi:hypothetical protein
VLTSFCRNAEHQRYLFIGIVVLLTYVSVWLRDYRCRYDDRSEPMGSACGSDRRTSRVPHGFHPAITTTPVRCWPDAGLLRGGWRRRRRICRSRIRSSTAGTSRLDVHTRIRCPAWLWRPAAFGVTQSRPAIVLWTTGTAVHQRA